MHPQAFDFVKSVLSGIKNNDTVLEIGSRDVNGTTRQLFPSWTDWVGIDKIEGPNVTKMHDGAEYLPEFTNRFDVIVCTEVLEHTPDGRHICDNAHDYLKKGGVFVITAAGEGRPVHSGIDGCALREGEHYQNVTEEMMRDWLRNFSVVIVAYNDVHHDIYAVAVK